MIELKGRKIAVLGLGRDGIEMIKALIKAGAFVSAFGTASDLKQKEIREKLRDVKCQLVFEPVQEDAFSRYDLMVDTPGSDFYLNAKNFAKRKGVSLLSDLDLAFNFIKTPIIAVTGTNGKTTTVHLISLMLEKQGYKVCKMGGDFTPWGVCIVDPKKYDYYILELSSRRLEVSSSLHAHIAVLLNLYPAHGNRHQGGLSAYINAKAKIFANQTEADYLVHDITARNISELIRLKLPLSTRVGFSFENPMTPPGAYKEGRNLVWISSAGKKEIYSIEKLQVDLPTVIMDLLAALAVASLCKVEPRHIQGVIDRFTGLPSRMELIRKIKDVYFVDDSRSSNIGSSVWALSSTSRPIIWITGGALTGEANFKKLPQLIKGKVKLIILIESEAARLIEIYKKIASTFVVTTLKDAIALAYKKSTAQDMVLFSPGCLPDPNSNWGDRPIGEEFQRWAKSLREDLTPAKKVKNNSL